MPLAQTAIVKHAKHEPSLRELRVALMLPCLNEELTLAKVIRDFKAEIPSLDVTVFDNGSTDRSVEIAVAEGANVIHVPLRGKGNVVRRMFEAVDADVYIMVDSDDTYEASGIWKLLRPVFSGKADMTVASRLTEYSDNAFRKFHRFGNTLIMTLINWLFRSDLTDICSGYRVMSKHFVKNIPLLRDGFEIETELTVHSLIYGFKVTEVELPYRHRPPNSHSKLHTLKDGYRVILTIVGLARDLRPLLFFAGTGLFLLIGITIPAIRPRSSFLHMALTVFSVGLILTGLVLNTINVRFSELQVLMRRQNHPRNHTEPDKIS